ncbi:uncharacterized protein LOC110703114 [Chenopodium quinoa]|uniref:uncharacterized protein LOC110703114 n=1 Tax=Chenopodium quinoa TaxID=63459 RepID=UPI000B77B4DE|nr:uncharacterized protein LOC110703114 [Chenopodium quinoa]
MGFRDLKCFNQALLAKQVWRLMSNPESLASKILKARYFKNTCVMEARRGYDPSYTWRSIWGAKGLLRDGLVWRVGNGANIRAWKDAWLVKDGKPISVQQPNGVEENMLVHELLSVNGSDWDVEKVRGLVDNSTAAKILATPISHH